MSFIKPREPIPLISTPACDANSHAAVEMAVEMVLVHNCLIGAINSMFYYAPLVKEQQDIRDFLHFCATFVDLTHHHHDGEETYIFPTWAEATNCPEILEDNVAEHQAFHDGLDKLGAYAKTTDPVAYTVKDLLVLLDAFTLPLVSHLRSEIDRILGMQKTDHGIAKKILDVGRKNAMDGADNAALIPFIFACHDRTFEGGKHYFPPMPMLVRMGVVWWYGGKYQSTWRFCPSDLYSRPKEPILGTDSP